MAEHRTPGVAPPIPRLYSDQARRLSDIMGQAASDGHRGKWLAVRLSDGGTDGVVYDSRADAVRFQLHETLCCYVQVQTGGMQPHEAEAFIQFHRKVYDAGYRLQDPDGPAPIMPQKMEDLAAFLGPAAMGPQGRPVRRNR